MRSRNSALMALSALVGLSGISKAQVTQKTQIQARIVDGVGRVEATIRFHNAGRRDAESVLLFPLPEGAVADGLELEMGGKKVEGKVEDAKAARRVYLSIVRRRRDPALLEYAGKNFVRLRVFPIPAGGTQEVVFRYSQVLPMSGGLYEFRFPCRALGKGSFSIGMDVKSQHGLENIYAPSTGWDIKRKDKDHAVASYESSARPQQDPRFFFSLARKDFGLSLLTYKKKGEKGYFLMLLSPKRGTEGTRVAKSITFVVDVSGSMRGEKIQQAKGALRYFLSKLNPGDEFNITPFSTEARPFSSGMVAADEDAKKRAMSFIDSLEAAGGTNIHDALLTALSTKPAEGKLPIVAFLTDGLPTVGITKPQEILASCKKRNGQKARIFVFGVGSDVNTFLLDSLCESNRGTRDYVRRGENIEVKTSALFSKLANPALSDLAIEVDGPSLSRWTPSRLPDLFHGEQLVVAGRYDKGGHFAVTLKGKLGKVEKHFVFDASFAEDDKSNDFVRSIWAKRRVGQLLDAIRLNGPNQELISEIKTLASKHGIVTPYTSNIAADRGDLYGFALGTQPRTTTPVRRRGGNFRGVTGAPVAGGGGRAAGPGGPTTPAPDRSGARAKRKSDKGGTPIAKPNAPKASAQKPRDAVRVSLELRDLKEAEKVGKGSTVKRIQNRSFRLEKGRWVDQGFTKALAKALSGKIEKIEAFSERYFAFVDKHPELLPFLSLEGRILLVVRKDKGKEQAVEIIPAKKAAKQEAPKGSK